MGTISTDERATLVNNFGWLLREEHDIVGARHSFEEGLELSRHFGARAAMSMAILGLACLASDIDDIVRAAKLHGAAQTLRNAAALPWGAFAMTRRAAPALIGRASG